MQWYNVMLVCWMCKRSRQVKFKRGGNSMARTIQGVIDLIIASVSGAPQEGSVDTFKCGDPTREVKGIVTTFTATLDALRKAVELGANLVITHEPTFYDHQDSTYWLEDDPIYRAKRDFIEQNGLTIWRFHDYWHMHQPDGILTGMLKVLGWESYQHSDQGGLLLTPPLSVATLAAILKEKLALASIRVVGNAQQQCERIGLLVGAIGGEFQIKAFHLWDVDLVICGETVEWQTCEYVRDAVAMGYNKALIIVGHAKSEEEGMRYLAEWLQPKIAEIPITYVAVGDPIITL
jgi:putative NIF3 family GTP cyclohydrolase 1 type 2